VRNAADVCNPGKSVNLLPPYVGTEELMANNGPGDSVSAGRSKILMYFIEIFQILYCN
jgi:hypothetical protein